MKIWGRNQVNKYKISQTCREAATRLKPLISQHDATLDIYCILINIAEQLEKTL